MAQIRVYNPINPKRKKPWTYQQAQARKDQAERFVRSVLQDDDRADEIAAMSAEEYAAERGKEIAPNPRRKHMQKKISTDHLQARESPVNNALEATTRLAEQQGDLYRRISELETEKQTLQDKLDEITEILECEHPDCDPEDHLEEIAEVVGVVGDDDAGEE
jgi:chromosome segregation ATPase